MEGIPSTYICIHEVNESKYEEEEIYYYSEILYKNNYPIVNNFSEIFQELCCKYGIEYLKIFQNVRNSKVFKYIYIFNINKDNTIRICIQNKNIYQYDFDIFIKNPRTNIMNIIKLNYFDNVKNKYIGNGTITTTREEHFQVSISCNFKEFEKTIIRFCHK